MYTNYRQEVVRVTESTMNENPHMSFRGKQIDAGHPESVICTSNGGAEPRGPTARKASDGLAVGGVALPWVSSGERRSCTLKRRRG